MLLLLVLVQSVVGIVDFTGDVVKDFAVTSFDPNTMKPKNFGVTIVRDNNDGGGGPDVGVPTQLPKGTISGWDINAIYWQYDYIQDDLLIGIDCFGICGDADGDGNPGSAGVDLAKLGGQDIPDLARGEGIAIVLDFNQDVADFLPSFQQDLLVPFDFVIGIPAGQPAEAVANPTGNQVGNLPCTVGKTGDELFNMQNCFGLYDYQLTTAVNIARRFLKPHTNPDTGAVWPVINGNPNPSRAQPDLEWKVRDISILKEQIGAGFVNNQRKGPWEILIQAFAGSFLDAGVGEDYLPSQTSYELVSFQCLEFDVCDVCLGLGDTCNDCAGVPNGPNIYDKCDVCGGDDSSCWDCARVPNGPNGYDVCDVCRGDGTTCLDCKRVPNGPATYDICDICDGDGTTCFDCAGIPNGPTVYDKCDVCGGDSSTCLDCKMMPNGPAVYDKCDVCGGDSSTCLDCAGMPNGAAVYDKCDICNGDSSTCLDCLKVPNGPHVYDVCDVCNGDGTSCFDCAGVPLGTCEYDVCDVCCGDGTTCLDCNDTPFGTCKYDNCGVCCGDGSSCVCLKIHCVPTVEVDHALLEWSLVATIDRIEHTVDVLEGIKEELCRYDVNRGNLASDIAGYLSTANEFRDILDNFVYVQIWFKDTIDEALQTI